jgi:nicotinamidase-related amidase
MTVTVLDPVAALLVVDLQNGARARPTAHPLDEVVASVGELASAFRGADLPVVLISNVGGSSGRSDASRAFRESGAAMPQPPEGWQELLPELGRQPGDRILARSAWGAFVGTTLDDDLKALGVTQVVLTGIATSLGVESTAREARDRGYNVVFATDAMTDLNPVAHDHSVSTIFPYLGESGTTAEIGVLFRAR